MALLYNRMYCLYMKPLSSQRYETLRNDADSIHCPVERSGESRLGVEWCVHCLGQERAVDTIPMTRAAVENRIQDVILRCKTDRWVTRYEMLMKMCSDCDSTGVKCGPQHSGS